MQILYLSNGMTVFIDDEDYGTLSKYTWSIVGDGYAHSRLGTTDSPITMHSFILLLHGIVINNLDVDHEDGNRLNNQKYNLRIATRSQNLANSNKHKDNTSGYKGVTFDNSTNKWKATICCNYRIKVCGRFDSAIDAAVAYDKAAVLAFGKFAKLNFPGNYYFENIAY